MERRGRGRGGEVTSEGRGTYEKFWAALAWSLRALWEGQWPAADASGVPYLVGSVAARKAGTPSAGGYFCTLWVIRADLDFLSSALGLSSATARQPCACCKANSSTIPWTDHRPASLWRGNIHQNGAWILEHPDRMPLFRLPGVGIEQVHPDLMHCKHLGSDQYYYGSILKFLTHHLLQGPTEENLERIWVTIKEQYRLDNTGGQFGSMRVTMYSSNNDFARLKGKAGELRHFGKALLAALERHMNREVLVQRQMRLGMLRSIEVEDILGG